MKKYLLIIPCVFIGCQQISKKAMDLKEKNLENQTSVNPQIKTDDLVKVDTDSLVLYFLGYVDNNIMLRDKSHFIYLFKGPQEVFRYTFKGSTGVPLFINDAATVFFEEDNNTIILEYRDRVKVFPVKTKPVELVMNSSGTEIYYFFSYDEKVKKMQIEQNKVYELPFKGYRLNYIDGKLYFLGDSDDRSFVDVFYHYKGEIVTVVKRVFDEGLFISPDEKFIACLIPVEGIALNSIYSIDANKHFILNDQRLINFSYVMYDPLRSIFLYYKPTSFQYIEIEAPIID